MALFLTTTAAYALVEKKLPGRRIIMFYFVFTMLFKGGMIPTYITIKNLGLLDTNYVLILIMTYSAFNMIIMKSFFEGIPESLRESASIDGASEFTILWRIVLPLSRPVETSGSAGIACGLYQVVRQGLVPTSMKAHADHALLAVVSKIGEDGTVTGVSGGTPVLASIEAYNDVPVFPTLYGQGLVLMLLTQRLQERLYS